MNSPDFVDYSEFWFFHSNVRLVSFFSANCSSVHMKFPRGKCTKARWCEKEGDLLKLGQTSGKIGYSRENKKNERKAREIFFRYGIFRFSSLLLTDRKFLSATIEMKLKTWVASSSCSRYQIKVDVWHSTSLTILMSSRQSRAKLNRLNRCNSQQKKIYARIKIAHTFPSFSLFCPHFSAPSSQHSQHI